MYTFLVACSIIATLVGLIFSGDALFAGILFALLARLVQAGEQHRALLTVLRGDAPEQPPNQRPGARGWEQHVKPPSSRETERRWQETLKERGLKD